MLQRFHTVKRLVALRAFNAFSQKFSSSAAPSEPVPVRDNVVLITGASSGIGAATAVHFAKLGYKLALAANSKALEEEKLAATADICLRTNPNIGSENIITMIGDLTVDAECENIVGKTVSKFSRLDVLIANAGIFSLDSLETLSMEHFDRVMNVNFRSVVLLMKLAIPHIIQTKGNIVNVSSLAGLRSYPGCLSYSLSKAALVQLTRCVALEVAAKGVRVNSVNPGVIEATEIFSSAGLVSTEFYDAMVEQSKTHHPLGRAGKADEVARAIAFLASDQEASFITGVTLTVDGGRGLTCL